MPGLRFTALFARTVLPTLSCVLLSCNVYDPELIAVKPGQSLEGRPSPDSGLEPDGAAAAMDGSDRLPSRPVAIDTTHCGDGRVTGEEKCDIGIPPRAPGACPTSCPSLGACIDSVVNNPGGCQAVCEILPSVCKDDDDCCPGKCTDENDNDCSSHCGDGMVQADSGETCEPDSSTPCKSSDADCNDNQVCSADKLVGSAANCNAVCTNTPITEAKDGDGCCPPGNNANTDKDCASVCGNMVRELTEDCDGSAGCSAQCTLSMPQVDQMRCLEKFNDDECARCSCMNCTATYLNCRDSPDATVNKLCNDVLVCAQTQDCYAEACYCGTSFLCADPDGECKAEIELATGSTELAMIRARSIDPNYAVGRAYAADMCRMTQCATQCRAAPVAQ